MMLDGILVVVIAFLLGVLVKIVQWVMHVVTERDKLSNEIIVASIYAKINPRMDQFERRIDHLSGEVASLKGRA